MMDEIQSLMDGYWKWLRDKTTLRAVGDVVEITAPYLDRHNDYLQIYAKPQDGGRCLLTDGGHIVADLEMCGCNVNRGNRKRLLESTTRGFGVRYKDGALEVEATRKDFSRRKHNLIQAMLAVNDLFYTVTAPSRLAEFAELFNEIVKGWLDGLDVRCVPQSKLSGKSGYDHYFDFIIPKSKEEPERLIRVSNYPNKNSVQSILFSWLDTQKAREDERCKMYVLLNDSPGAGDGDELMSPVKPIPANVINALENDGIIPVPWSKRDAVRNELAV